MASDNELLAEGIQQVKRFSMLDRYPPEKEQRMALARALTHFGSVEKMRKYVDSYLQTETQCPKEAEILSAARNEDEAGFFTCLCQRCHDHRKLRQKNPDGSIARNPDGTFVYIPCPECVSEYIPIDFHPRGG